MKLENTLADLMVAEDNNLPERLRQQEENLKREKCVKPEIGKWLEDFEMPVLLEILNSSKEYFHENFAEMESFDLSKRQAFAKEVEEHGKNCPRCSLKIKYDSEWEEKTEESLFNHRGSLREVLENAEEVGV